MARYIITVKIERIHDVVKDRYEKVIQEQKVDEMVNVRMLANSAEKAKNNAIAAVNLIGDDNNV